jgi:integrase
VSIRRRQTATGVRYDVHLRDANGRMYQRTFRTKREAEAYQAQERTDRARGTWVDPRGGSTPFGEVAAEWLRSNPAKRPSAIARDETIVRLHLLPPLGRQPIASITPRDVQQLVNQWCKHAKGRTVRRQYGTLRAILNAAVEADVIGRSPCRGINLPAVDEKDPHIVDADELLHLAMAMDEHTRLMAYLGAVQGLRWGECAGLKVGRLDFLRSEISVRWQRTRGPGGVMVERPPKSAKGNRTEAAPKELMDLLAEHLATRGLTGTDTDAYVFVGPNGGPLDYSDWYHRIWQPARNAIGLPKLKFHNLRDANITGMVAEGVDVKTAQTRAGHADPRVLLGIYAQATTEADRRAAELLGERFMRPSRDARYECQDARDEDVGWMLDAPTRNLTTQRRARP